jgi:hypothetical protein
MVWEVIGMGVVMVITFLVGLLCGILCSYWHFRHELWAETREIKQAVNEAAVSTLMTYRMLPCARCGQMPVQAEDAFIPERD